MRMSKKLFLTMTLISTVWGAALITPALVQLHSKIFDVSNSQLTTLVTEFISEIQSYIFPYLLPISNIFRYIIPDFPISDNWIMFFLFWSILPIAYLRNIGKIFALAVSAVEDVNAQTTNQLKKLANWAVDNRRLWYAIKRDVYLKEVAESPGEDIWGRHHNRLGIRRLAERLHYGELEGNMQPHNLFVELLKFFLTWLFYIFVVASISVLCSGLENSDQGKIEISLLMFALGFILGGFNNYGPDFGWSNYNILTYWILNTQRLIIGFCNFFTFALCVFIFKFDVFESILISAISFLIAFCFFIILFDRKFLYLVTIILLQVISALALIGVDWYEVVV